MPPTRMCVSCRERFLQSQLVRLQYKEEKLQKFTNFGRSFYLCEKCSCQLDKKTQKSIARITKNHINTQQLEIIIKQIKETSVNG